MDKERITTIVRSWAENEDLVKQAILFGSRARNDYRDSSDIDIALVLYEQPNDSNLLSTWVFEKERLTSTLQELLPYKLDLQLFDGENTKTILSGINESSIMILDKG